MLSSKILFDIHIDSLWYQALEMLSSEILFDIHIASLWYQALEMLWSEILFDIHIASVVSSGSLSGVRNAVDSI